MVDKHFLVHQNKHKLNESINNPIEHKNTNIKKEELFDTHTKLTIEESRTILCQYIREYLIYPK